MPFSHMVIFVDICLIFHLKSEILSEYLCPRLRSDLLRNISGRLQLVAIHILVIYVSSLDRINGLKQRKVQEVFLSPSLVRVRFLPGLATI